MIALRSVLRRKTKNLSAILAITLGVTLLVGIQITTDTLENAFTTSLLQREGEVDFTITSSSATGFLSSADAKNISKLVPDAVGIMPELNTYAPLLIGSQFDDRAKLVGVPTDFPEAFGAFYDWQTGDKIDLSSVLASNTSVLLSSKMAEKLGIGEETDLPFNINTEFTNLTASVQPPPRIPNGNWTINTNTTTAQYVLNSSSPNLSVKVIPVNFVGAVTLYTINTPRISLADYEFLNVTASGSNNTAVIFGLGLDDNSTVTVANMTTIDQLNALKFDLSPYSERSLRGDAFIVLMSMNGTQAEIEVSDIKFETTTPIITYTPTTESVDLQVVSIFDSKRPGIGSQYSGVVFKLEHLQQWLSLKDPDQDTDIISSFSVALKTDHFISEIDEDYLKAEVDRVKEVVPEKTDPDTGEKEKIYTVSSARLTFFSIASIIMTILSTMLTALGLLIMITGVLLITNVQLMNVEDREFQTGVLRAVGENRRGITRTMLIENVFQGMVGGVLGLFGGLGFGQIVASYLVSLFGTGEMSVQPIVSQQVVVLSVLAGVALGVITGVLPAMRASRVNIVEALRGIKIAFKGKSRRNFALLGLLAIAGGVFVLLINGVIDESYQAIWVFEGWDTLDEWRNILIGAGLLFSGIGLVLSRFISPTKALNFTAITVWAAPVFLFTVAMGEWIPDITGLAVDILIISVMEIVVGSVLLVSVNLPPLMKGLRGMLVRLRGVKGVGQIAPALISSHKTRSTLTFAIFAVILTLNVVVATLVSTNLTSVIETEEDARGIDIIVALNKPEMVINGTSYAKELTKLNSSITDVIEFKTYRSLSDFQKFVMLNDPFSSEFDQQTDVLPLGYGELTWEQIRGNESEPQWRYDFYLSSFPDGIKHPIGKTEDVTDEQLLNMTHQAYQLFFNTSYTMAAYNVSMSDLMSDDRDLGDLDFGSFSGYSGNELKDVSVLKDENGTVIQNPVVFTDSFLLPLGLQIWVPMNTSEYGFPIYQTFTVAGRLDTQRAGGFPLSPFNLLGGEEFNFMDAIGKIYFTPYWANQTNFLAQANGNTTSSRAPNQYNQYLIKTSYDIDDPELLTLAQTIMNYTNTEDEGYRKLVDDNTYIASATVLYSKVEQSLEMIQRVVSFLQIYVTFGLVIGAIGMTVIAVRNVSERKREIGMMRAIGFPRSQVMISVLLELVVLGIIGLVIGVVDGVLISIGFANMQGATLVIPWNDIAVYLGFITLIALVAGFIPGWVASRIPPAEALRYVG